MGIVFPTHYSGGPPGGAGIVFTMSWALPVSAMSPLLPVSTSQVDGLASARLHHRGAAAAKHLTDDEKKKHAKAGSWPFTKFTPTDEGWKIERREATDAEKEFKKNQLEHVGTIMP